MRRLRIARGLTQEADAERAGLVTRHLQKIEAAEVNVTLHTLVRLALTLGVDAVTLFQEREGDTPSKSDAPIPPSRPTGGSQRAR